MYHDDEVGTYHMLPWPVHELLVELEEVEAVLCPARLYVHFP